MSVWDRTDDPTSDQLLAEWASDFHIGERQVRSHRRPPRFTRAQLVAAAVVFVGTLSVGGGSPGGLDSATAGDLTASGASGGTLAATETATEQSVNLGRQGGDRVSRGTSRWTPVTRVVGTAREQTARARWVKPLARVRVTSCFGPRWGTTHKGLDLDASSGTPIRAVGAGRVVQAGWNFSGMGYSVTVDHGAWLTVYAHASRVLVKIGQRVTAGTKIALVGATGHVTGTHLHLAVARSTSLAGMWDRLVDPARWLRARGVPVTRCA